MYMYEMIIDILERKGSIPLPKLCLELSQSPLYQHKINQTIHPATVKSVISRKNDLFLLKGDLVTIHPDKQLTSLVANVGGSYGSWYKVEVDFITKKFNFFEWHKSNGNTQPTLLLPKYGDVDTFKNTIYRMNIWDWEKDYQLDGIILDGTSWSMTLTTVGKVYESKGLQSFPHNWKKFCSAVQTLTGKPFQ